MPSVFLSYSWDSEEHRAWVRRLAADLRARGVDAWLDQWDVQLGDDVTQFMERAVAHADYVLLVCTESFARKADNRTGGVGYEQAIVTSELLSSHHPRGRFVCALRSGVPSLAIPGFMRSRLWVDFRDDHQYRQAFDQLLVHLFGRYDDRKPPLGQTSGSYGIAAPVAVGTPCGWVLVAGTGAPDQFTPFLREASASLGSQLATHGYGLITGGWPGVDETVARGFADEMSKLGWALEDRLIQIVVEDEEPAFAAGQLVFVAKGEAEWFQPIRRADAVILVGGLGGTWTTGRMALDLAKPVLPLADTGGDAKRMYLHMLQRWDRFSWLNISQQQFQRIARPKIDGINAAIELLAVLPGRVSDD